MNETYNMYCGTSEEDKKLLNQISERLYSLNTKVEKFTSTNTGRQFALQMPPTCNSCLVRTCTAGGEINSDRCYASLWRHFCRT